VFISDPIRYTGYTIDLNSPTELF